MSVVLLGPDFTVDNLVTSVQLRAILPSTPTLYTSGNIIQLMDEEMRSNIIPLVKLLKEEYWVVNYDQPVVSGQTTYSIPYRATLQGLRDLVLVDASGNQLKLVRYEPEDVKFPLIPSGTPYFPLGYYFQDNSIILFPTFASQYTTYTLRMRYERRPNNLISMGSAGQVTAINGLNVTLTFVPTSWTTSTTLDIINNIPPFNSVGDDISITAINGLTLTLSSVPATTALNFWVAQSMLTPVPQIPYEAFPILSQMATVTCLRGIPDQAAIADAQKTLDQMKERFTSVATPRNEGTPKTLSNRGGVFDYGQGAFGDWGN